MLAPGMKEHAMSGKILVTGSAGFVGFHLCRRLLAEGHSVCGFDGMTPYYDVSLKRARHDLLRADDRFQPVEAMLEAPGAVAEAVDRFKPDIVVHLAAQAGVRYSIEAPRSYVESNLIGTFEVLEAARAHAPAHLLMASTSSAYGANTAMPYAETDRADHQLSFYAATKKATESMAHSYAHLFRVPTTMFRFFTVYGPWGRPDMAYFLFIRAMLDGRPIDVFNHGDMKRDFTYVDDLVEGIRRLMDTVPGDTPVAGDSLSPVAPFRVVNLGNGAPVALLDFIAAIEDALGVAAEKVFKPMQPGDVPATWADTRLADALIGKLPSTDVRKGVGEFVRWYRDHYGV
jgi:UDP-glucuronate 4-epimerase